MAPDSNSFSLPPRALTIAGFDPSGGAGVVADIRTFAQFGFQASGAITSITFQNASSVVGAIHQSAATVRAQVMPLLEDGRFACTKTGMLPTREVVLEVARLFRETDLPRPVVDPVMQSTSGWRLMEASARDALLEELLPLAELFTPNIPEAEELTGIKIESEADMRRAAGRIRALGTGAVLIKGGHLHGDAIDVLDNRGQVAVFRERRVSGGELHGSGCILSAAIAAGLGKGMSLQDAIAKAKDFVLDAIRNALLVPR